LLSRLLRLLLSLITLLQQKNASLARLKRLLYYDCLGNASLLLKHDPDDFDGIFVAPFLLTPPCQKRNTSATSLKSNPRKL